MRSLKFILLICVISINLSCGVCINKNLEFKNIKYFTTKSLENIDQNSEYDCIEIYEADRDFKKLRESWSSTTKKAMKFQNNGFIEGIGMSMNHKNEQGIIYTKNGKLFIHKIGGTQDNCKFIETYKLKIEGNRIYLLQYGGITNQKMCFVFQKINVK